MRAREFIDEGKNRKEFRKGFKQASPNHVSYNFLDNNNHPYIALRFGIALAGSPDFDMDKQGPNGSRFNMIDYTEADAEIRRGAEKIIGVKPSNATGPGSEELDFVNTKSPIPDWNKHQVKKKKKK